MPDNENTPKVENLKLPSAETFPEEETKEAYSPMLHAIATDNLSVMAGMSFPIDKVSGTATLTYNGLKVDITSFNDLAGALDISTFLLLCQGIIEFTKNNNTGKKREIHTLEVAIPLKEYGIKCGYDLEEHEKDTPEEAAKEKKRVHDATQDFRNNIKKYLEVLRHSSLSWSQRIRGKDEDFLDIGIVGSKGIHNGYIYMSFTQEWANYLINSTMTHFPDALFSLDKRNKHAIPMGLAMTEHYYIDDNQRKGTANLLKVRTLLNYTSLKKTPEELGRNRSRWEDRIKEPFENILDRLKASGVLEDWYYSHSKGVMLTDEESRHLADSFEVWVETLVHFTLKNPTDQTARLEAREEEYKERQEKKKTKRKAAKKKANTDTSEETDTAT